jgi:hypothetical protein
LRKAVRLFHTKPPEKPRVQRPSRLVGASMDGSLTGTIGRGHR